MPYLAVAPKVHVTVRARDRRSFTAVRPPSPSARHPPGTQILRILSIPTAHSHTRARRPPPRRDTPCNYGLSRANTAPPNQTIIRGRFRSKPCRSGVGLGSLWGHTGVALAPTWRRFQNAPKTTTRSSPNTYDRRPLPRDVFLPSRRPPVRNSLHHAPRA